MRPPPPPDGSDASGGSRLGGPLPGSDDQAKAKLDDTELAVGSPRALQKVELDLDDAPFLEDEEEVAPPPPQDIAPPSEIQDLGEPVRLPLWKNKKIVISGGGLLLLLIGLAVWWFFLRAEAPPPPPPPPPPVVEPPKPVEPPPPPPPQDVFVSLDPFLVEKTDAKGAARVLTLKIKLVYKEDPRMERELQSKSFALRDGLYYNLKNKSFAILTDKDSIEQLREELKGVVNNYLNAGQVDQILFEELLVK